MKFYFEVCENLRLGDLIEILSWGNYSIVMLILIFRIKFFVFCFLCCEKVIIFYFCICIFFIMKLENFGIFNKNKYFFIYFC